MFIATLIGQRDQSAGTTTVCPRGYNNSILGTIVTTSVKVLAIGPFGLLKQVLEIAACMDPHSGIHKGG